MGLDQRLVDLGFELDGKVLRGHNIDNCQIRDIADGYEITTPQGEVIEVHGVTLRIGTFNVGKGKTGLIL